jgi:hypothetical protein
MVAAPRHLCGWRAIAQGMIAENTIKYFLKQAILLYMVTATAYALYSWYSYTGRSI